MGLAQCRKCGKEVSTEAVACPHCGVSKPTAPSPSAAPGASPGGSPFGKAPSPPKAADAPEEKDKPLTVQRRPHPGAPGLELVKEIGSTWVAYSVLQDGRVVWRKRLGPEANPAYRDKAAREQGQVAADLARTIREKRHGT